MPVVNLDRFTELLASDRHLAVLITQSPGSVDPQVSVVNASVVAHPVTGEPVAAVVARTGAKLANLRIRPRATLVARCGWEWAALRGHVELSGPDDDLGLDADTQRTLLRRIYTAAGGQHPDMEEYDAVMLRERRCALLIRADHTWSNPSGSEHLESSAG